MIQKIKNQNISHKAFTLIEMVVVLVIIGIMLMATVFLSGEQIQKVKNKTVKESILAEMQSRYSRNLGSSSFAGIMYNTMEVYLLSGSNEIKFTYNNAKSDEENKENVFTDRFKIIYIANNYNHDSGNEPHSIDDISLVYKPYKITCQIGSGGEYENIVLIARVNDSKNYCFEIDQTNCRLKELTESNCENLKIKAKKEG